MGNNFSSKEFEDFVMTNNRSIGVSDIWNFYDLIKLFEQFRQSNSSTKATDDVRERITAFRRKGHNPIWKRRDDGWFIGSDIPTIYNVHEILSKGFAEIYSALSKDKVEFKIGDIVSGDGIKNCMIEEFYIASLNHFAGHHNEDGDCIAAKLNTGVGVLIDHIEKSEEKKVLFTTLDDVKIYHDDKYWIVNSNSPYPRPEEAFADERMDDEHLKNTYPSNKRFSTKEAAEQWIAHNTKSISYMDLENYLMKEATLSWFVGDGRDNSFIRTSYLLAHFKPKESATKQ